MSLACVDIGLESFFCKYIVSPTGMIIALEIAGILILLGLILRGRRLSIP